ncbi:GNAT family N-acetyltransferase [Vibrio sp. vnigr-6D03]|uniref:GNAT family N-acetyltransferase n=1 Tax=Vibrio sp. vnigr-6D03 TaxID=2058088 RepID=UPI0011AEE0DF|nr:GNAT family N-acetyltransferase [Vibrio sp. vnigr-6D03]
MEGTSQTLEMERYDPQNNYDFSKFDCGTESFNSFLTERMNKEYERKICIPHLCFYRDESDAKVVVGYYTLGSNSFERSHLSANERKKMTYSSVPCILLSKIAICKSIQGTGCGKRLLGHAIRTAYVSSLDVAVYALFLQSRDDKLDFYKKAGMIQSKVQPNMFIYPLKQYENDLKRRAEKRLK